MLPADIQFRPPRQPLVEPGQIEAHVADMTATIAADVPLESVQNHLAQFNQWLPIDGDSRLPVGKLVETNSTGPLRLGYGAWRDLLLGCQFKTAGGQLITAGGRTIKNVAGYDLVKLMVGQHAMLGNLLTITSRTYARPEAALVAEFDPSDQWLGQIIATPLRPRWAILQPGALICGWIDDDRAISLFQRLAAQEHPHTIQRRSLAEDIQHRAHLWQTTGDHFRAALGPSKILRFAELSARISWSADAAFGIIIGPYSPGEESAIQNAAETCGGSVTFFAEGHPPRWNMNPVEQTIWERLKKAFVPDG